MTIHSVYDVHLQFSSAARDILYCILHLIFALLVTSTPTAHNDHITKHSDRLYAGRQYLTKSNTVKKKKANKKILHAVMVTKALNWTRPITFPFPRSTSDPAPPCASRHLRPVSPSSLLRVRTCFEGSASQRTC